MNENKCPKCERIISRVYAEAVEIAVGSDRYRGFSYACPNCQTVLSVQMNPLTLKDDALGELQASLGQVVETLEHDIPEKIGDMLRGQE